MSSNRLRLPYRGWILALVVLAGMGWLCPGVAAAQQLTPPTPVGAPNATPLPGSNQELKILPLKYLDAEQALKLLRNLFGEQILHTRDVRIVPEGGNSNRLIVLAPPADLAQLERIIHTLDVPNPGAQDSAGDVRVYALKHLEPGEDLARILKVVLLGEERGEFALDRQRKQLVVRAQEPIQQAVAQVLRQLDVPAGKPEQPGRSGPAEVQVRIVWLVSGLAHGDNPAPPEDLKEVVAELAKLGIEKPRLAAQTIVNTLAGAHFQAQGVAALDKTKYTLRTDGTVAADERTLKISLRADQVFRGMGVATLCNLETQITAPPGHSVVLGVTPSESLTSVFVVQLLPQRSR